ncbi:MAG TPA: phosphoadenosine phosphosulfate reductase family protein, partial [Fervidobacterium sp.]|nr:phosphoadenosine phosphosulfate reductase family protein [Fervidobacterium sp.]
MATDKNANKKERHILALSGGKDSAALAVYMRDKHPEIDMEYVFTDSGCELPETYEYLDRIRAVLNIDITVVKSER